MADGLVAKVRFIGDSKDLLKATKKIQGDVGRLSSGFRKLGNFAKIAIGGFAVTRVIGFLKQSVRAADDAAKAQRRLDAVFTASGAKGLKLFKDLNSQAKEISLQFGIDDDEVVKVQERLSAYLEAFASQGKEGSDKFKLATQLAFDIDAAGLADAEAAAKTIGRVLLEPLEAANRLKKLGIQLTNDEIDSIKELVAQGRIAEAQSVILNAIARQVGGVAEANASAIDRLNAAVQLIVESIGILFLPLLEPLAKGLATVAEKVAQWTDENSDFVTKLNNSVVPAIKTGISEIKNWIVESGIAKGVTDLFNGILVALGIKAEDAGKKIDGLSTSTENYSAKAKDLNFITQEQIDKKLKLKGIVDSLKNSFINTFDAVKNLLEAALVPLLAVVAKLVEKVFIPNLISQLNILTKGFELTTIGVGGLLTQFGNLLKLFVAFATGSPSEIRKALKEIEEDAKATVARLNDFYNQARAIASKMTGSNTIPAMNMPFAGVPVTTINTTPKTTVTTPNVNSFNNSNKNSDKGNTVVKEISTNIKSPVVSEPTFDVGSFRMGEERSMALLDATKEQNQKLDAIAEALERQRESGGRYTVNVQTLQPTAQTGKAIVDAIKQFEDRSGGGGYRTALAL
jgi:hypothetical protein